MVKTIKIKDDNIHSRLAKLGSVSETYEDVIRKLLDFYEKNSKDKNKK
jgi:predicted CopG family antitoxin